MPGLNFKVTDENIDDILCIAFEGGINYWCGQAEVKDNDYKGADYASHAVSKGATVILLDAEDIEDPAEITKEKMIKAVEQYVNNEDSGIIDLDTKEIDCCMVDAGVADMIVQYAAFGEIVFG